MVVVMLFGSPELTLEAILTGSEVGCTVWAGVVGVVRCRIKLDGLDDVEIEVGVVVADGEDIEVDRWLVVELTSESGRVVDMSMLLGGITGAEGMEVRLHSGEIYHLLPWQADIPAKQCA